MGTLPRLRRFIAFSVPASFTLFIVSGLFMSGLFIGCEKVVHDTVEVALEVIVVDSIEADSYSVEPGASDLCHASRVESYDGKAGAAGATRD